jgi:hypothetical protein
MIGSVLPVILGILLLPLTLVLAASLSARHGAWRVSRALGRAATYILGSTYGGNLKFHSEGVALREEGKLTEAAALATARLADKSVPALIRNVAIDILISAGAYETALRAEPLPFIPTRAHDALGLVLIQINLAETDYNLGRWGAAEARLRHLDLACWCFPIARAGLLQQRA